MFWPHLGVKISTVGVEEANCELLHGLNSFLYTLHLKCEIFRLKKPKYNIWLFKSAKVDNSAFTKSKTWEFCKILQLWNSVSISNAICTRFTYCLHRFFTTTHWKNRVDNVCSPKNTYFQNDFLVWFKLKLYGFSGTPLQYMANWKIRLFGCKSVEIESESVVYCCIEGLKVCSRD